MNERVKAPLRRLARERVDGSSLAVIRIALGAVVVLSAVRTFWYGWTDSLYAAPTHRFTYLWLGWVPQPGPVGVRLLVGHHVHRLVRGGGPGQRVPLCWCPSRGSS